MWYNNLSVFLFVCLFVFAAGKRKTSEVQKHEEEDAYQDKKSRNRSQSTTGRAALGEVVVERFVETLMSSERYLKMIETVERKLNHLDATFHERTNSISKYLSEILKMIKTTPTDMLENALRTIKSDLDRLKLTVSERYAGHPNMRVALSAISCEVNRDKRGRRKNDHPDKSLWKKEYEDELTEAMLSSRKRENKTRVAQSTGMADNEVVIEKLMDSLTASEKYLKKVDSIDFRLNRLDIEVHEKTNSILKQLTDIMKAIRDQGFGDKLETVLDNIKTDVNHLKHTLEKNPSSNNAVDGVDYHGDSSLDSRISLLESHTKHIMTSVDSIVATISEVKSRQYSRTYAKPEANANSALDAASLINEFRKTLRDQKTKKCDCNRMTRVDRSERYPTDCHEIQMQGFNVSGIYKIKPEEMEPFYVLCDLTTAGGGWTVFQNRFDGSQDFYKGWTDYVNGFGNLAGEFWLGLEKLSYLTNQKLYELRIELENQHGQEAYAGYSVFTVGPESEGYRISTLGSYYGTAGDSLSYHAGQKFSTMDTDNDEWRDGSCASEHGGAWWYKECDKSNLNGKYSLTAEEARGQSIYWISYKGPNSSLTKTKMMIRPLPASKPIDFGESNRKILESPKLNPFLDQQNVRPKETKAAYDVRHRQAPYRYDEHTNADVFFPNYA